jgi:hypothetical protein
VPHREIIQKSPSSDLIIPHTLKKQAIPSVKNRDIDTKSGTPHPLETKPQPPRC